MRVLVLVITFMLFFSGYVSALESTNWFKITQLYVSNGDNLHFRVFGMQTMNYCPNAADWAYVGENDSGAKGKISSLLSAYAAGKEVRLVVEPTNFYSNGVLFFKIVELGVLG